ncbi:MAG: malto-oligosyltrehalose synthase [Elusimicrobia bacterium]|nr:malto-oligosyltrehalose synthase [Elusimicrobiota bacterium]
MRTAAQATRVPAAAYRLQLGAAFTFGRAARLTPYLRELGVDAAYLSPCLKAVAGSLSGYDVIDHGALDPALGGAAGFERLCARLERAGLARVVDFVPNHMGLAGNPLWRDVLERGPASPWAGFFDIDWEPAKPELKGKVLLPVLGCLYGDALEAGELRLVHDAGVPELAYGDQRFPLSPESRAAMLRGAETPALLEERLAALNGRPGDPRSFDALHELHEAQNYRLAHWRVAAHEINYRRFFNINSLAAIRMEDERVFRHCHRLIAAQLRAGRVDGLRIDHPDGLYEPAGYLAKLQRLALRERALALAPGAEAEVDAALGEPEFEDARGIYLVVEKILGRKETLRPDWPVHGTVGYDYLNALNGLYVQRENEAAMSAVYSGFIGEALDFARLVYQTKKRFTLAEMSSEIQDLGRRLDAVSELSRRHRDFTRIDLVRAIGEVIDCLPVYRTYIAPDGTASPEDEKTLTIALERAKRAAPGLHPAVFDFVREVLLMRFPAGTPPEQAAGYRDVAMRFQQLSAPAMAKGLEDTAMYVNNRLLSLNEVGGDPEHFGWSAGDFHRRNAERAERWPASMLAASTHDSKRGEDVRLRLDAISEVPEEWKGLLARWAFCNEPCKTAVGGKLQPGRNTEYLIYQTLLGAWQPGARGDQVFFERVWDALLKSVREAKQDTNWNNPDAEYESALRRFLESILAPVPENRFLPLFEEFQGRLARWGMLNSLSALALRLGSPGVVDVYQGDELWNLTLVDPDNRRPVDFRRRVGALRALRRTVGRDGPERTARKLARSPEDGRIKLFMLWRGLRARRRSPALFVGGGYSALRAEGPRAENVVAFLRTEGSRVALSAGARFFAGGETAWEGTGLRLPPALRGVVLEDAFTGRSFRVTDAEEPRLSVAELFRVLPGALALSALPG